MLRLCIKNIFSRSRLMIKLQKEDSKLKYIPCCPTVMIRSCSTKLKEDDKSIKIYYGPLTPQIRSVKIFSLSSSVAGLVAQPIILKEATNIGSTSLIIAMCSVVGFFTFVTPVLLHLITKKYVTDITYDPSTSKYKATTINFFLVKKQLEFKVEDVTVPDVPGMFTTMHAKGIPLFIEARHFTDPMHYVKIMGYDKPMDFKMGEVEEESKSK